ncbi:hypothetical protein FRC02_006883 [Tulasnella sp. 418]|nr:hypothetical protein FRC02_006883 [Tulasnella sp. 418]
MFIGRIFSAAVLGFTALAGIATASVVPAPAFDVKPRAEVNSTQAGLDIVTKFQTNVYGILPKLGHNSSLRSLLRYYDETAQAIASLPPVKDTDVPDAAVKTVDIVNETSNSVNAVVNILNPTEVNAKNARLAVEKTDKLIAAIPIVIPWQWPPIIIMRVNA